jgi:hypothetical protein
MDHDKTVPALKSNIRIFPSAGKLSPIALLEAAKNAGITSEILILGWVPDPDDDDKDETLYVGSTLDTPSEINWMLDKAKGVVVDWDNNAC